MSAVTSVVLATGGITAANELIFAPLSGHGTPWKDFNWRIIPATGILALALKGVEVISPHIAMGLAVTGLITALITNFGNAPAPILNIANTLGYGPKQ
jgi:hypothetical protein